MPMNEIDATTRTTSAATKFASGIDEVEEDERARRRTGTIARSEPVEDREDALAGEVHRPRERRHERVLDRPLPALPGDRLHEELEDDPEVGPDDGADQQRRHRRVDVERAAGRLDALRDEDDRERVRDRPDEERDVPPDVALGEVDVALDDAAAAPTSSRAATGSVGMAALMRTPPGRRRRRRPRPRTRGRSPRRTPPRACRRRSAA